jgi:2-hydroxychromene-2-carboxylate isomerase
MTPVRWYFDYISPYSYLQHEVLGRVAAKASIDYRPVLFAGLLEHHGQKGPAEIPAKKVHTFREIVWRAHQHGIELNLPAAHPFNPLPLLRLSIALGNRPEVVRALFRHVWVDGHLPDDTAALQALCDTLGVSDAQACIQRPEVKAALRANTEEAIARGVFGVPSLLINDQVFWGFDMTDAALACLDDDPVFRSPLMQRAEALPDGVQRRPK